MGKKLFYFIIIFIFLCLIGSLNLIYPKIINPSDIYIIIYWNITILLLLIYGIIKINKKSYKENSNTPIDYLNRDRILVNIKDYITNLFNSDSKNGTIGVFGERGSGKTFLLNMLSDELKKNNENYVIVNFEPFIYLQEEKMLEEFFKLLTKEVKKKCDDYRLNNLSQKFINSFLEAKSIHAISDLVKIFFSIFYKNKSFKELKKDFEDVLNEHKLKVVVTVDDLDRCDSKMLFHFIRMMNVITNFKNVVYVVFTDSDETFRKIQKVTEEENNNDEKISKETFLTRFFDLKVYLPDFRDYIRKYTDKIFEKSGNNEVDRRISSIIGYIGSKKLLVTPRMVDLVVKQYKIDTDLFNKDGFSFIPDEIFILTIIKVHFVELYNFMAQNERKFLSKFENSIERNEILLYCNKNILLLLEKIFISIEKDKNSYTLPIEYDIEMHKSITEPVNYKYYFSFINYFGLSKYYNKFDFVSSSLNSEIFNKNIFELFNNIEKDINENNIKNSDNLGFKQSIIRNFFEILLIDLSNENINNINFLLNKSIYDENNKNIQIYEIKHIIIKFINENINKNIKKISLDYLTFVIFLDGLYLKAEDFYKYDNIFNNNIELFKNAINAKNIYLITELFYHYYRNTKINKDIDKGLLEFCKNNGDYFIYQEDKSLVTYQPILSIFEIWFSLEEDSFSKYFKTNIISKPEKDQFIIISYLFNQRNSVLHKIFPDKKELYENIKQFKHFFENRLYYYPYTYSSSKKQNDIIEKLKPIKGISFKNEQDLRNKLVELEIDENEHNLIIKDSINENSKSYLDFIAEFEKNEIQKV